MNEIVLTWPARELHPNWRGHWSGRAKAVKVAREAGYALAVDAGWHRVTLPDGRLHLWIDFYPPDHRKRDDDGLLASMKAARGMPRLAQNGGTETPSPREVCIIARSLDLAIRKREARLMRQRLRALQGIADIFDREVRREERANRARLRKGAPA